MSRFIGHVVFQSDSKVEYLIFNSTVEQCYPELYKTHREAVQAFLDGSFGRNWPDCTCGGTEPIIIFPYDDEPTDSDHSIHWSGTACRKCQCIDFGLSDSRENANGSD